MVRNPARIELKEDSLPLAREQVTEWMARIPLGQFGNPDEIVATDALMAGERGPT
jgi:hypothetical protein